MKREEKGVTGGMYEGKGNSVRRENMLSPGEGVFGLI